MSALLYGTLNGLSQSLPSFTPIVFDYGQGVRRETMKISSARMTVIRCGAQHTRRLYRAEALARIRVSTRLGGVGSPAARLLLRSAAVLDLSGGDSFTDLYGPWRFRSIVLPKLIALEGRRPLFLLPQTYGPFSDPERKRLAAAILRRASMAWARDPWSYTRLQELVGDEFEPSRHREGVDVAFLLEGREPPDSLCAPTGDWLDDSHRRIAGINVSGLLYNGDELARTQYGLKADYRAVVTELVRRLLDETDWSVVLVPHVTTPEGHYESDLRACRAVVEELGQPDRLLVAPSFDDPRYVKWLISRLDWFCGTRMHSAIAALSSSVPTAAIAYSPKTLGVFRTCNQAEHVADPRKDDTAEVIDQLFGSWQVHQQTRAKLADTLPTVLGRARTQMNELAAAITQVADPAENRSTE